MTNKEAQDTIRELNKLLDTAKEIIDKQDILIAKQRGCLDLCLELLGIEEHSYKEDVYDNLNKLLKGGGVKKFE